MGKMFFEVIRMSHCIIRMGHGAYLRALHTLRGTYLRALHSPPRCLFKGSVYLICILALSKSRFLAESKKLKEEEQGQSENEDLQVFEIDEPHYCLKKLLSIKILL